MPLPTFLIVGVPRAGTTSLAAYLAEHPDIFLATGKELHFFNGRHDRGLDWYRRQFEGKPSAAQRGEATPGYLYNAGAIELMARTLPDAQLIVVFRNPVDRAYSHYWLNRWRGIEPLNFEAALAVEGQRLRSAPSDPRRAYVKMGCYVEQLERLFTFYEPERVHTVFFEDLKTRPQEAVAGVCRFLGVEETVPDAVGDRHNHHGPARSARLATLARRLPGPACRILRSWNTRDAEYPPMAGVTRLRLTGSFAVANQRLPSLLGMQPPWLTSGTEALP